MNEVLLREGMQRLQAAGVEEARLEAQLLLALTLGVNRVSLLTGSHPPLTEAHQQQFASLLEQRLRRVPLAYLRGTQEFYGLTFHVTSAVLIPRPETECLVELVLERGRANGEAFRFADVGTGSGCIPIAALAHLPVGRGVAFDLSAEALAVANHNAHLHRVTDRIQLVQGDLLISAKNSTFHLIVSNPPYIPTAEIPTLQAEVRDYEPRLALDGGTDGLTALRRLLPEAYRALLPGGWLAVEVAAGQAQAATALFAAHGFHPLTTWHDLAGIERCVVGEKAVEERQ